MSFIKDLYFSFSSVETSIDINFSAMAIIVLLINAGYYFLDWYFVNTYPINYGSLEFHRKRYVIKNILKAYYLTFFSIYVTWMMIKFYYYNQWSNYELHNFGIIYMLPDLISLIRVPKLDRNTVQHHVSVVILAILNLFCDYSEDVYWRGMVIYGYMSMLTGVVNYYLGYRILTNNEKTKRSIAKFAYYNYLGSIAMNWLYQIFILYTWLFTSFPIWGLYVYLAMMYFIVKDDLILLSFLNYAMLPQSHQSKMKAVVKEIHATVPVTKSTDIVKSWSNVMTEIQKIN